TLKELISQTMVRWSQEDQIQDPELVRIMYTLLRRQYDSIGELLQALRKAYTISAASVKDTINLLAALGQIRSLLSVRMGKEEELLMINGLGYGINAILFLNLPHTARLISKEFCTPLAQILDIAVRTFHRTDHWAGNCTGREALLPSSKPEVSFIGTATLQGALYCFYSNCCLLSVDLLLACLTSNLAEKSHLKAASVMDNNELALALEEPDLDKVVTYLAGCGLQSCPVLLAKGYPDIGWNPIEGERYLSFLRFAVFVN
ncbi:RYR3 protein, partial [Hydrobates tethys]|nr:RYR3 protein [Oceanodroma tethys]